MSQTEMPELPAESQPDQVLLPAPEAGDGAVPAPDEGSTPSPDMPNEPPEGVSVPDNIKRLVSLSFTILAALLYGAILGGAVIKTLLDNTAVFSEGALRATQILSGLVGTVVTAGFARSRRVNAGSAAITQDEGLLLQSKLLGLADTLGLNIRGLVGSEKITPLEDEPARTAKINTATWVAGIYFVIYFLVGAGAFALTILRSGVPDIVSNSAWVWLGTLISSSYTFFGLEEQVRVS